MTSTTLTFENNTRGESSFIRKIPAEVYILIMKQCRLPNEIQSFISADRIAFCHYVGSRHHILQHIGKGIHYMLGQDVSISKTVLMVKLRLLRQKSASYSASEYRNEVQLLLRKDIPNRWPSSLGFFGALSDLILDADLLIDEYIAKAWEKDQRDTARMMLKRASTLRSVSCSPGVLSKEETARLYKAIFRYESYSSACFRGEDEIVQYSELLGGRLYGAGQIRRTETKVAKEFVDFFAIMNYVYGEHSRIFSNAVRNMRGLMERLPKTDSGNWPFGALEAFKNDQNVPETPARHRSGIYKSCTGFPEGQEGYIRYLCSQGLPFLRRMQAMDLEAQQNFTISNILRISMRKRVIIRVSPESHLMPGLDLRIFDQPNRIHCFAESLDHKAFRAISVRRRILPFWDDTRTDALCKATLEI